MKAKSWDPKTKARIILEGLRGRPVSEICSEYGVHNSQYYDWRDKFLKNVEKVFENGQPTLREWKLKAENEELKELMGELTLELKTRGPQQALIVGVVVTRGSHEEPLALRHRA